MPNIETQRRQTNGSDQRPNEVLIFLFIRVYILIENTENNKPYNINIFNNHIVI